MNTPEQQAKFDQAYQRAMDIIDQEWLAAGKTREELDQEKMLIELYDILLSAGWSETQIRAEWDGKTSEEIFCLYNAPHVLPAVALTQWDAFATQIIKRHTPAGAR